MQDKLFERFTFDSSGAPMYRQLADFISSSIRDGTLNPGDRIPPQRDLAKTLSVNLTTITRAFSILRQKGLVTSRAGSGSVVAPAHPPVPDFPSAPAEGSNLLDLTVNRPASASFLEALTPILGRLASDRRYLGLQDYHEPQGAVWAAASLADWLAADGAFDRVDAKSIVVTNGAQHALACTLRALCRAGDFVLADAVTYQGVAALCHSMNLELRGVAMDADGMDPDAFEEACERWQPRAAFLIPTLHNPTTITLSDERRRRLCQVAERYGIVIIEDDVYRPLFDEPRATLASRMPEATCYIGAFSKFVAPGLRFGFAVAPPDLSPRIAAAVRLNTWCVSPLNMLIATLLIERGTLATIIEDHKVELRARQEYVTKHLGSFGVLSYPTSTHAWLRLPEPWSASGFAAAARRRGVSVLTGDVFAVDRNDIPHAVRLNIGAPRSHAVLDNALSIIANILRSDDRFSAGAF